MLKDRSILGRWVGQMGRWGAILGRCTLYIYQISNAYFEKCGFYGLQLYKVATQPATLSSAENKSRVAGHKIHIFQDRHLKFGRHDC